MLAGELAEIVEKLPADMPVFIHIEQLLHLQDNEWGPDRVGYLNGDYILADAQLLAGYEGAHKETILLLDAGEERL
ncbi:MAG: hypothetical protein HFJ79_07190 [Clostridiales bacterium]|jgi:hypothetical protein|nr:hypothetical protein [Clostridiales bacterium]